MAIETNQIIGIAIVILNLIPFILKKPKLLFVTSVISLIILFLLQSL
ncbi:MAG: hypothetical protein AABW45_02575 [Nanoarchaeota archaeon]